MSNYLYYCPDCNKLYKAGAAGKMIKCTQCARPAFDMNITNDEYSQLSAAEKQQLKNGFLREQEQEQEEDIMSFFENVQTPSVQKPVTKRAAADLLLKAGQRHAAS